MKKTIAVVMAMILGISVVLVPSAFAVQEVYAEEVTEKSEKAMAVSDIIYTVLYTGEETNIDDVLNVIDPKNGRNLRKGRDYELTYKDNVEVGTATIHIDGIGEYEGCHLTTTYKIVRDDKENVRVILNKKDVRLYPLQKIKLKAYVDGKTSHEIEWKSSDTSIAKVSKNGKVTAVSKGEVTITATLKGDQESAAVCKIRVKNYSTKMHSKVKKIKTKDGFIFHNELITSYSQMKKLINKYSKTSYDKSVMKQMKKYDKEYFETKAVCIGTIDQSAGEVTSVQSVKKVMKSNGKCTVKVALESTYISDATSPENQTSYEIFVEISKEVAGMSDKVEIK